MEVSLRPAKPPRKHEVSAGPEFRCASGSARNLGHDAIRVGKDYSPGIPDEDVLRIAEEEKRGLITDDRDFGELVFRYRQPHTGIIYLRLGAYVSLETAQQRLEHVIARYADHMDRFLVVSLDRVRVR